MAGRNREEFLTPQGKGIWNIPGIGSGNPQQLVFCTQMLNTHGKTLKPTFIGGGQYKPDLESIKLKDII